MADKGPQAARRDWARTRLEGRVGTAGTEGTAETEDTENKHADGSACLGSDALGGNKADFCRTSTLLLSLLGDARALALAWDVE
jgi:hypothetical protein